METWKCIPGWENIFWVSNTGLVRNASGKILTPAKSRGGYLRVHLNSKLVNKNTNISVHRLVAIAFCPNPDNKKQINHIDGDKTNNNADNLEWCTPSENCLHKFRVLGMKQHNSRPVLCVDTGEVFESTADAGRAKGINCMHIAGCCRGDYGRKSAGGLRWKWANPNGAM